MGCDIARPETDGDNVGHLDWPGPERTFLDQIVTDCGRVVDQNVEPSFVALNGGEYIADVVVIGMVAGDRNAAPPGGCHLCGRFMDGPAQRGGIRRLAATRNIDGIACCTQCPRYALTGTAARACNNGNSVAHTLILSPPDCGCSYVTGQSPAFQRQRTYQRSPVRAEHKP